MFKFIIFWAQNGHKEAPRKKGEDTNIGAGSPWP
jgi:hypothetical protein